MATYIDLESLHKLTYKEIQAMFKREQFNREMREIIEEAKETEK